jgi:hypothetical protein
MFRGFKTLRELLADGVIDLAALGSPAEVLAVLLDRPQQESQFALYMSLLGTNASLLDRLRSVLATGNADNSVEKERLISYVIGHVLLNAILRYPGPILSERALCAYLATTVQEADSIGPTFSDAVYSGPFSGGADFYWRSDVDAAIDQHAAAIGDVEFETSGEFNRAVIEMVLDRSLADHDCPRCYGKNGGYLCPFTDRVVCERADCSVAANSWIPAGADLSRVERDFYDEWSPLLGL